MISSLYTGVTALKSVANGLQLIGNNISNVNSVGYKSSRARFTDNHYQYEPRPQAPVGGAASARVSEFGTGTDLSSVASSFHQGSFDVTGLDLDLAIDGGNRPNGGGFFEVVNPLTSEILYTRAGSFESLVDGTIVTRDTYQHRLQSQNGDLVIAPQDGETLLARQIDEQGNVYALINDGQKDLRRTIGQLKIANFTAPQNLVREGSGFYSNGQGGTDLAGITGDTVPDVGGLGKIRQYTLELSNVDLTNEFAAMITHQRSFQAASRVVTVSDTILKEAVNLKG
jgi:flagellar hook protein FlgE